MANLQLREKAKSLTPVVTIGKQGFTDRQAEEIKKVLSVRKLIKVKLLPSFLKGNEKKTVARQIADAAHADLIDQVGHIVVLYKR